MDVMRVKGRRAVSGSRAAVTLALLAASLSCLITATRAASLQAAPRCTPRPVPTTVDDLNQLLECQPSSRVLLIPYLWRPIHVKVSCPKRSYNVYTAEDTSQLQQKVRGGEVTWCMLDWKNFDPLGSRVCKMQLSPFKTTLVGIKGSKGCEVESHEEFSLSMLAAGAAGLLLFYSASFLSTNFAFRMSCGTAFFSATFLALMLVVLFRAVPHKKVMAAVVGVTGTTGLTAVRWLTGHWIPSWQQLVNNPYFAAYVLLTVSLGAAITFLYDDRSNPKINTVIKVTIRVLALALVYYSSWTSWLVASTALGLMVAGLIGQDVARGVQETSARVQHAVQRTHEILVTPFTVRKRALGRTPATAGHRTGPGTGIGPSRLGLASALGTPLPGPSAAVTPAAMRDRDTDLDSDADLGLGAVDMSGRRGLKLRATPPAPWEVVPKRKVKTFEEQMAQTLMAQAQQGAQRRQSARRTPGAGGGVPGASQTSVPRSRDTGLEDQTQGGYPAGSEGVSQLVQKGMITNPITGRVIKVGGDTYNKLVLAGYKPDVAQGTLVSPEQGGVPNMSPHGPGSPKVTHSQGRASSRLS